ncbi:hypothetical protein [Burkholderia vietnamiensis]|nr:hypothetical protein [Burkholderia vietnamiensis]MCA8265121.1 hypothetical protein [Burkholderia vietnamiensis]MCO1429838.1 hypothetical protein [Burkholderia vietnamiensis]UKV72096.1 hypothetical protein FOC29_09330 [Burkholderia vietnamiensis]HDR8926404.1 hypothetical protein [Burkholderia vietnamiensis]HDR9022640.1 hypothetical protein [Burkholderia vietnamiensis]
MKCAVGAKGGKRTNASMQRTLDVPAGVSPVAAVIWAESDGAAPFER